MREIKFRAWDKDEREMKYFDFDDFEVDYCGGEVNGVSVKDIMTFSLEYYSIMQFTGLFDKNKKSIYEDDIVKYFDTVYIIKWNNKLARFSCVTIDEHDDETIYGDLEIIGNIYENPNLLNTPTHT